MNVEDYDRASVQSEIDLTRNTVQAESEGEVRNTVDIVDGETEAVSGNKDKGKKRERSVRFPQQTKFFSLLA